MIYHWHYFIFCKGFVNNGERQSSDKRELKTAHCFHPNASLTSVHCWTELPPRQSALVSVSAPPLQCPGSGLLHNRGDLLWWQISSNLGNGTKAFKYKHACPYHVFISLWHIPSQKMWLKDKKNMCYWVASYVIMCLGVVFLFCFLHCCKSVLRCFTWIQELLFSSSYLPQVYITEAKSVKVSLY